MAITNPPRSGDLVDFLDSNKFRITIDTTIVVDFATTSQYSMDSLDFSYSGKTVTFSEIATPGIGSPTFRPEQSVKMEIDFGSGLVTYFTGRIKKRDRQGENADESIKYTAFGTYQLANEVTVVDSYGLPLLEAYGVDVTTITYAGTPYQVYGRWVAAAIEEVFELSAPALNTIGIPATIGTPGVSVFGELTLAEGFSLQNCQFVDAINQLAQFDPRRRLFFDDTTQTWIFPSITASDVCTLDVNSINLHPGLNYAEDVSNRFTAIHLKSYEIYPKQMAMRQSALLLQTWDSTLEDRWCVQYALGEDAPADDPSDYSPVYRRYWIPPDIEEPRSRRFPMYVVALFDYWSGTPKYVPIASEVDFANRVVYTSMPLIDKGNPHDPGDAKGVAACYLVTYDSKAYPIEGWPNVRYPVSGYEGTAYTMFGLERTKHEFVDVMELTTEVAQAKLAVLKDVVITGDLTVEGDPIPELINLQKRLSVRHSSNVTGLETIAAMFTGYKYEFGQRGKSSLSVSTDMSAIVRVN